MKIFEIIILVLAELIAGRKVTGVGKLSETGTIWDRKDISHILLESMGETSSLPCRERFVAFPELRSFLTSVRFCLFRSGGEPLPETV